MTLVYPDTRTEDTTDTLGGIRFPDPYRWLEEESDEVLSWQRAQSKLADAYVREWPHFERLRRVVERFSTEVHFDHIPMPRYAAGRWFRTRALEGTARLQAIVSTEPMGDGRVVFDPISEDSRAPFLSWIAPSPDGRILALGVCAAVRIIRFASSMWPRVISSPIRHRKV
jgi:prolyl oligopeptidase